MGCIEESIDIAAPGDVVWRQMIDVERWPEMSESVRAAQRLDDGPFREGSEARMEINGAPTAVWRVTAFDEGRYFAWKPITRGIRTIAGHRIDTSGTNTRVTLTIETTGLMATIFQPMIARVSRRNMRQEAAGLKRVSEAAAAGARL